jgi:hypothetical protein
MTGGSEHAQGQALTDLEALIPGDDHESLRTVQRDANREGDGG